MSVGVGFGDIVKAIGLAKDLVTRYCTAPKHVGELADETPQRVGGSQRDTKWPRAARQAPIGQAALVATTDSHHRFGSDVRKLGKRLAFDAKEVEGYRQQITRYNMMLNSFIGFLNISVASKSERKLLDIRDIQQHKELLDWLLTLDFGKRHHERLRRRQDGTSGWFPELDEFKCWVGQPKTTLYCYGMPGAGKSLIASIAIDHLQDRFLHDLETAVGFVLCEFSLQDDNHQPEDLLASLIKQLIQARPPQAPAIVHELLRRHSSKGPGSWPLMRELVGFLATVVSSYSRTFVVIDALDEYSMESRTVFLESMLDIQWITNLNILATLRPIQEITAMFEESGIILHTVEIRARERDVCMSLHCQMWIKMFFLRKESEFREEMVSEIHKASDGMFLLASHYLESIARFRTISNTRKAIQNLPNGPNAYAKIYAKTMEQLQHALAISEGDLTLDRDNTIRGADIISACEGLVTLDAKYGIIRLVHYTTREYLERIRDLWFPNVQCSILGSLLRTGADPKIVDEDGWTPLMWAVDSSWEAGVDMLLQHREKGQVMNLLMHQDRFGQKVLSVVCRMGYKVIVDLLLERDADKVTVNMADKTGWTALVQAAKSDGDDVISLLFQRAGSVIDVSWQDAAGKTALYWAAALGHLEAVSSLLQVVASGIINLADNMGRTPLWRAAKNGHEMVVAALLASGAGANVGDNKFHRMPLCEAAEHGYDGIVQGLLDHKAELFSSNRPCWALLCLGASSGTLKILVERKAAVDADLDDVFGLVALFSIV
ncbi:hypothetical protein B0H66DRAFT_637637 [Apodospora peruviana]|uniref:Nephrocystin 3-like N-terminal domain-containing protein n=1 Tax=Apodospora peruviana TaxID=516989 RepID=A0AAE0IK32_9PEZI|nr:hypothetical protein B0H66DRAFT_637637 [Apodospora peruviana]